MNPRRRPLALFTLAVVLVAAVWYGLPDPTSVVVEEQVGEETTQPATAGVWYCPSTDDEAASSIALAAPPGGERPSLFEANDFRGDDQAVETGELFPGAGTTRDLEDGTRAVEVRWNDRPLVTTRLVEHTGDRPGPVAGPCPASVATEWLLPGVTTAAGATAELHVGNPFSTEAAVGVDFFTAAGLESPLAVQNVPIPAGGTVTIDLVEVMPQREDLGVRVTARSGRVAVEGVQSSVPTINGVRGRSWVGATDRPATTWHVPWVTTGGDDTAGFGGGEEGGDQTEEPTEVPTDPDEIDVVVEGEADPRSWVWVSNPSDEVAELNLTFLTGSGRVAPELATPLQVNPESIVRVDLDPLLATEEVSGDVGVQVVSTNEVPVVVGGGAVVATGGGVDRTGLAVLAGQRDTDTNWSLTGPAGPGRRQLLTLGNPTETTARLTVSAWTGATSVRPADLQELVLAPGQTITVDLSELDLSGSSFTAFVGVTQGAVTASLRSAADEGPLGLSAPAGVPSRIWVSSGIVTVVRRQEGMVNRFGTDLGLDVPEPTPSPTPGVPAGDDGSIDGDGGDGTLEDPSVTPTPGTSPSPGSPSPMGSATPGPSPSVGSASPTAGE